MASVKETIKFGMLRYPTLFPNPVDVLAHLFCVVGNGYHWVEGELVDQYDQDKAKRPLTMKYPEEDEQFAHIIKQLPELVAERKLQYEAQRMQMKFVEDNIDTMLEGSPTAVYFGDGPRGCYVLRNICVEYAKAFSFPCDIKEDWAVALYSFLNFWLTQLNYEYGVNEKDDTLSWWPVNARIGRQTILATRKRLHPFAYNGQTYEQHVAETQAIFNKLK